MEKPTRTRTRKEPRFPPRTGARQTFLTGSLASRLSLHLKCRSYDQKLPVLFSRHSVSTWRMRKWWLFLNERNKQWPKYLLCWLTLTTTLMFEGHGHRSKCSVTGWKMLDKTFLFYWPWIHSLVHSFIHYKSTQQTCMHSYDRAVGKQHVHMNKNKKNT